MNGVVVHAQSRLSEATSADAVIVGSGIRTREIVNDPTLRRQALPTPRARVALPIEPREGAL